MRHDVSLCDGCHFSGGVISTNSLQSLDPYEKEPNWTNKPRVSLLIVLDLQNEYLYSRALNC